MKTSFKKHERMVAIFIISTILIILSTIVMMGKFNQWFIKKVSYYTELKNAKGLKKGSIVSFKENDWEIGEVSNIELNEKNNKVRVELKIQKKYAPKVRMDSIAFFSNSGFLGITGSSAIKLSIGVTEKKIIPGYPIPSADSEEGTIMLKDKKSSKDHDFETNLEFIASNINALTEPSGPLMQSLFNVESITRQLRDGQHSERITTLLNTVNTKVASSLTDINNMTSRLDTLVQDNSDRIDKTVVLATKELSTMLQELSATMTAILIKIESKSGPILDDTEKALKTTLKEVSTSITSIAGSLENNATASIKDIRLILQNVKVMTNRLNNMLIEVEELPIFSPDKKKRPSLIEQIDREDY